jgi:hypothetical protein
MRQVIAIPEEEEGNHDLHWRPELRTAVASGRRRTDLQDPQEDPRAGIREASKRDVQRFTRKMDWILWRG